MKARLQHVGHLSELGFARASPHSVSSHLVPHRPGASRSWGEALHRAEWGEGVVVPAQNEHLVLVHDGPAKLANELVVATRVEINLWPVRGVTRGVQGFQTPSSKLYSSTPPNTSVQLSPPMAKTLLPKVTAEKSDLISFMSGRGSH